VDKLSNVERIILANQFSIRKVLEKTDAYDQVIAVLMGGFEVFYDDIALGMNDPMPADEGRFVLDVLSMYRAIEDYKQKHADDAEFVAKAHSRFPGFDGIKETPYRRFVRYLVKGRNLFEEQLPYVKDTDDFDSHFEMIPTYKRMLATWSAYEVDDRLQLNAERARAVIDS
jgi:uncharacterized protein YfbU (UPF0304 family)